MGRRSLSGSIIGGSADLYDKSERAYKRLGEMLNRARRAGRVSSDAIRDDGSVVRSPQGWRDVDQFLQGRDQPPNRSASTGRLGSRGGC